MDSDLAYYKKCKNCGYETGKCRRPIDGNKRCWKCGNFIYRDFRKVLEPSDEK